MHQKSGLELKKFFNTSGVKYKELGIKDKIKTATQEELYGILASDGMLVKRPILTDGQKVLVGFKDVIWEEAFSTYHK
ncbi:ArsC family protein [Desulforamulus aeronauticus DSM 10349]|uniref:ArsC family protein n=1 Tax=Desulforamulus aeronauticus DSM 10349 TaxID=1121421 RepID=A0A1M6PYW2_9FIRM|nr:ArsC family protein [Desulforamulus aeronauticus DSM 10349]